MNSDEPPTIRLNEIAKKLQEVQGVNVTHAQTALIQNGLKTEYDVEDNEE